MHRLLLLLSCFLLFGPLAEATTVHDIELPESVTVAGEQLRLNGYGLRKKLFIKVYLGSLYTSDPVTTTAAVLTLPGPKLIRMDFIYKRVEAGKIVAAFAEGFEKNSPQLKGDAGADQFLSLFKEDFVTGDRVDLQLLPDGSVSASHNGKDLGSSQSPGLAEAVLLIYLGDHPADSTLKQGLLGNP